MKPILRKDLVKGSICYSLLSSYANPNTLIPVKGKVMDVKWDDFNPQYLIRIDKFYDSSDFLRRYLLGMNFSQKFDERAKKLNLNRNDFKNLKTLEERLRQDDAERFYVVVDSLMTCKTLVNMYKLFDRLQFFMICSKLRDIREFSTRSPYHGKLRILTKKEFDIRVGRFIGDLLEKNGISYKEFIKTITK